MFGNDSSSHMGRLQKKTKKKEVEEEVDENQIG
jgi:hypothetical protein